ncbi:hypothetical protein ACFX2B_027112 [Malus domestica]
MLSALDLQLSELKLLLNEIGWNEAAVLEDEAVVPSRAEVRAKESDHGFELFLHHYCETGEQADQDEDANGKLDNEGGSSWDFVNRLSQLKAVDIFCTALPEHPRRRQSFVNMSCVEKRISFDCIPYSQSHHRGLGSTRRTKHRTVAESE